MSGKKSNVEVLQDVAKTILKTDNQEQIDAFVSSMIWMLTSA